MAKSLWQTTNKTYKKLGSEITRAHNKLGDRLKADYIKVATEFTSINFPFSKYKEEGDTRRVWVEVTPGATIQRETDPTKALELSKLFFWLDYGTDQTNIQWVPVYDPGTRRNAESGKLLASKKFDYGPQEGRFWSEKIAMRYRGYLPTVIKSAIARGLIS